MTASFKTSGPAPHIGRYANILLDAWFKRTFTQGPNCKKLLMLFLRELITDRHIEDISYGPQEAVNPNPGGRGIRLDIECTDSDGSRFLVEMQRAPQMDFYQRAVFNSTFGVQRQLVVGNGYDFAPVYFIGIMDFTLHAGDPRFIYRYSIAENESHEQMTDRLNYIFLELPKCGDSPDASVLEKFGFALHNMYRLENVPAGFTEEVLLLLFKSAELSTFTPEEKQEYQRNMTSELDIKNQIAYAHITGLAEGKAEGKAEGLAEGKAEGKAEVARKMLERDFPVAMVAEVTGLSEAEIMALRQDG